MSVPAHNTKAASNAKSIAVYIAAVNGDNPARGDNIMLTSPPASAPTSSMNKSILPKPGLVSDASFLFIRETVRINAKSSDMGKIAGATSGSW